MVNAKPEGNPYCNHECFVCFVVSKNCLFVVIRWLLLKASTKPVPHVTINCICTTSTIALTVDLCSCLCYVWVFKYRDYYFGVNPWIKTEQYANHCVLSVIIIVYCFVNPCYWLNPAQKTNLQMGEAIVVEQFCHVVGAETQAWIRCLNSDNLEYAVKLAEDLEDSLVSAQTGLLTSPAQRSSRARPSLSSPPSPGLGLRPPRPPTPMGNLTSPSWRPRCHQPGHQAKSCPSTMECDVAACNSASEVDFSMLTDVPSGGNVSFQGEIFAKLACHTY
ncbi:UNVERIFIED_CONTAM: hypothetical protein FKN15_021052 [Acipenser sinensis]